MTGTSVLAIQYKDGIMMAADNLGAPLRFPYITFIRTNAQICTY